MNWPISARRFASASLFSTLLFAATGCEDASDLGVELPGTGSSSTEYQDFLVNASTVLQDSVETLKTNSYLIGRVRDNALGTTTANGYFNLKLSTLPGDTLPSLVAGTAPNPQLDSVVLVMPFESVYGSATTPLRVNVYPLVNPLDDQGIYNSNSSVAVDVTNALGTGLSARLNGSRKFNQRNDPSSTTDTSTFKVTVPDKTVRLKLNSPASSTAATVFSRLLDKSFNQSSLDAIWKGLAIQPVSDFTSAVVGFSTNGTSTSSVSRTVFYYHYANKKANGTLRGSYSIPFGNRSAGFGSTLSAPRYFTEIKTDLLAPFNRLQGAGGSALAIPSGETGDVVYTQLGNGIGTKLEIPGLQSLKDQAQAQAGNNPSIAINRAELLIPVQPYTNLLFASPNSNYLYEVNQFNQPLKRVLLNSRVERLVLSDAVNQLSPTVASIGNSFSGDTPTGYYQQAARASLFSVSDVNRYYDMVLTGYVQSYVYNKLSGAAPAAFILSPQLRQSGALGLERAVLDGKNIKLRVYYSKLQ
ncbi:DUF4270 family protein [Hymenobacter volaticus]|uniref:DUF4270 domain-containing protein n=1 Tax=Hymenobacter volaticus TaxID=2932254 RepID=A0ABY4G601_9BACT|nr:DUF4270 family protein [Hymenobacter volaticus]UOQ66340.1 DUF4270 domain-containing protein [Hymenobacter volaticus]